MREFGDDSFIPQLKAWKKYREEILKSHFTRHGILEIANAGALR